MVRYPGKAKEGLVQVNVAFHEAGDQQAVVPIDGFDFGFCQGQVGADLIDLTVADQNIGGRPAHRSDVLDE